MACHSYVLLFHPHVTRMYSYVTRMSLVCTRMSPVCHAYVLVSHPCVTRMWFYQEPQRTFIFCFNCNVNNVPFSKNTESGKSMFPKGPFLVTESVFLDLMLPRSVFLDLMCKLWLKLLKDTLICYTKRYTKISQYVCVQIKTILWKFHTLYPKNSRVMCPWSLKIS